LELEVIGLFLKTGSKNSKHAAVLSKDNISATSCITVQVFEHMHSHIFCTFLSFTAPFATKGYLHIDLHQFLLVLSKPVNESNSVQIANTDFQAFKELKMGHSPFTEAMRQFAKRKVVN